MASLQNLLSNTEDNMKNEIEHLRGRLNSIRAGRANPAILDKVVVDYYGTPTPIQQMAAVSVAENRILVIQPWDKSALGEVEKAIIKADIGITPNNDGSVVRLVFPQPTEERRKELCRDVRAFGEQSKVAVREVRREANDVLRDAKDTVSEDEVFRLENDVQELTDKYVKEIDKVTDAKEKEVLEI